MTASLASAKRIVVKIGSSLLTNAGAGLDRNAIADWARQKFNMLLMTISHAWGLGSRRTSA